MDAAGKLAQLLVRERRFLLRAFEEFTDVRRYLWIGGHASEEKRDCHEALLRTVVQVALDPLALTIGRFDDPGSGCEEFCFRMLAVRDVAEVSGKYRRTVEWHLGNGELHRNFASVRPKPGQLDTSIQDRPLSRLNEPRQRRVMTLSQRRRDDEVSDVLADGVLLAVPEGDLGCAVEGEHVSIRIDRHYGVERRGKHRLEQRAQPSRLVRVQHRVQTYGVADADAPNLRVVVAEDQSLLRDAIASLLELAGVSVVGRYATAHELLNGVDVQQPDVAIVDIRMPPTFTDEGLQAAAAIRSEFPRMGVLVLSQHVEPEYAARLAGDDARGLGYLLKERVRDGEMFIDAVRRVASGGTAFDSEVIAALLGGEGHTARDRLTDRELQTLSLMAEGLSNAAIASRLHMSSRAVEREITAVFAKLELRASDAHNRRVLAVLAFLGV